MFGSGYNGRMPPRHPVAEVIRESALLILLLIGLATTTVAFGHATVGLPLLNLGLSASAHAVSTPVTSSGPVALRRGDRQTSSARPSGLLPSHVFIQAPFTAQAPFGDWSDPYGEACEEAAVAMALAWSRGEELSAEKADTAILNQIAYEEYTFGHSDDTAVREVARVLRYLYGHPEVRVVSASTVNDIRAELAAGNVVLLPMAGAILANPYYLKPPPYHMVLAVGYDDVAQELIVHDPGTRRGANWRYPYPVIERALHDWTGSEESILEGGRAAIVVGPLAD